MENSKLEQLVMQRTAQLEAANKELSIEMETRKKSEEKLLMEHNNFLKIFSAVPIGLLLLDSNTEILHANQAIYSMVLREPSTVIGLWAGGGLGCVHSLETSKGCGFSDSCPACPLRKGLENVVAERSQIHGEELDLTVMIDGKPQDRFLSINAEPIEIDGHLRVIVAIDDITDRKKAEQALKESEKRISSILETEPECVKTLDLEGNLVYMNSAGLHMLDADNLEQIIGKPILPLISPEYKQSFDDLITNSIEGDGGKLEFQAIGLKGRKVWLETNSVPLRQHNDEITGVLSITRDITKRKQSEEKLEESKEKYRGLSEATFEAIFISERGICIEQNLAAQKMFGYSDEEAIGRSGTEWITPEDREMVISNMLKGYEEPYEVTALRKDGTTFPCIVNGRMMRYKGNDVRVTAISDITALKRAEEELKRSISILTATLESTAEGVLVVDKNRQIINFNQKFITLLGIPEKLDLKGKNEKTLNYILDQLKNPESVLKTVKELFINGIESSFDVLEFKDGRTFERFSQPQKIDDKVVGRVWSFHDITKSKKAEEAIKKREQQLRELNATKDKFFSIISHDLKSPFNSILGFSDILLEQVKGKDYVGIEDYANIIHNSSKRALKLLMNLFEWARLQTGEIKYNPEYIEMVTLVKEIVELAEDAALQKNINISCDLPHNVTVVADKAMISTVLRNLVSNAIKFTHSEGKVVITVSYQKEELVVSVRDNGLGIEKETHGKLFKINEGVSRLGTNNEKGTGLGLILCKEFIEKHHGRIWVDSEVEKGSVFYFTLP